MQVHYWKPSSAAKETPISSALGDPVPYSGSPLRKVRSGSAASSILTPASSASGSNPASRARPIMPIVTFSHTGATLEIEAGGSFLTACEASDAPADFGCQAGACGVCILVVEEGADNMSPGTEEELELASQFSSEATARLGCQIVVNGDITVRPG